MCTSTNKKLFVTTDNWQLQSPNAAGRQPLQRIERVRASIGSGDSGMNGKGCSSHVPFESRRLLTLSSSKTDTATASNERPNTMPFVPTTTEKVIDSSTAQNLSQEDLLPLGQHHSAYNTRREIGAPMSRTKDIHSAQTTPTSRRHDRAREKHAVDDNGFFYTPATQSQDRCTQETLSQYELALYSEPNICGQAANGHSPLREPSAKSTGEITAPIATPPKNAAQADLRIVEPEKPSVLSHRDDCCQSIENMVLRPLRKPVTFATAGSGAIISISQPALAKAGALLSSSPSHVVKAERSASIRLPRPAQPSLSAVVLPHNPKAEVRDITETSESTTPLAFTTAGRGVALQISEDSLSTANRILDINRGRTNFEAQPTKKRRRPDSNIGQNCELSPTISEFFCSDGGSRQAVTFSTAGSGNAIEILSSSLARAENLLENRTTSASISDVHKTTNSSLSARTSYRDVAEVENGEESATPTVAFLSAKSGKKIAVSASALAKASEVLEDLLEPQSKGMIHGRTPASPLCRSRLSCGVLTNNRDRPVNFQCSSDAEWNAPVAINSTNSGQSNDNCANSAIMVNGLLDYRSSLDSDTIPKNSDHVISASRVSLEALSPGELAAIRRKACSMPAHRAHSSVSETTAASGSSISVSALSLVHREYKALKDKFNNEVETPARTKRPSRVSFGLATAARTRFSTLCASKTIEDKTSTAMFASAGSGKNIIVSLSAQKKAEKLLDAGCVTDFDGDVHTPSKSKRSSRVSFGVLSEAKKQRDAYAKIQSDSRYERSANTASGCTAALAWSSPPLSGNTASKVIQKINSVNATQVRFDGDSGLPLFIWTANEAFSSLVGNVQDYNNALRHRGCDTEKISEKWIRNHSRWIIWKLASMERTFSLRSSKSRLSFDQVNQKLYNRFNREVAHGSRSPLRKVLNRDVSANVMMILMVSRIVNDDDAVSSEKHTSATKVVVLELSDGWYSVESSIDVRLRELVERKTIRVGTKLLVSNAGLLGAPDGVDPLDASYDPFSARGNPILSIHANSTRMARWDSRLGFLRPTTVMKDCDGLLLLSRISAILEGGGQVPLVDVRIVRRYPIMFFDKQDDGNIVSRRGRVLSEKEENRRLQEIELRKSCLVDQFTIAAELDCERVSHPTFILCFSNCFSSLHAIFQDVDENAPNSWKQLVANGLDLTAADNEIDGSCRKEILEWNERRSKLIADSVRKRVEFQLNESLLISKSVPFVRVLIQNVNNPSMDEQAMLTLWNPSDEQLGALSEGSKVRLENLTVKDSRYEGLIQLSGNRSTRLKPIMSASYSVVQTELNLFQVHKLAKDLYRGAVQSSRRVNVVGCVVGMNWLSRTECGHLCITDRSGLALLIKYDDQVRCGSVFAVNQVESGHFGEAVFRDLTLPACDLFTSQPFAIFTRDSSVSFKSNEPSIGKLRQWSKAERGRARLCAISNSLNAGLPLFQGRTEKTAVGYIADLIVLRNQQLLVKVDSGGSKLRTWSLPLALVTRLVSFDNGFSSVALNPTEEKRICQLKSLAQAFRARRRLFRFSVLSLRQTPRECPECDFQIVELEPIKLESFLSLYVRLCRQQSVSRVDS